VNAEQQVCSMQKLPRKVGGRIFFVSHRQVRNNLWSRGIIAPFSSTTSSTTTSFPFQGRKRNTHMEEEFPII
jgi:hypothetical protein